MITVEGMLLSARAALQDPSARGLLAPMFLASSLGDARAFQTRKPSECCDECGIAVYCGLYDNYDLLVDYYGDRGDILSALTWWSNDLRVDFWVIWPEGDALRAVASIGQSKHVDVTVRVANTESLVETGENAGDGISGAEWSALA